jgi:PAS domain-containing protein
MSASLVDDVVSVPVLKRQIASQMERWKSLVDNANMLVFGLDTHGRINFVNPTFFTLPVSPKKRSSAGRWWTSLENRKRRSWAAGFKRPWKTGTCR